MTNKSNPNDPYAKAGVNIDDGNTLIKLIKSSVNDTHNKSVMGGIGGFAGLYELIINLKNPCWLPALMVLAPKFRLVKNIILLEALGRTL